MKKIKVVDEKILKLRPRSAIKDCKEILDNLKNGYKLVYDYHILVEKSRLETDEEFKKRKEHEQKMKNISDRGKVVGKLYNLPEEIYKEIEKQILKAHNTKLKESNKKVNKNAKKNNK